MNGKNTDVKDEIRKMGVWMYEVARQMKMSPSCLCKRLTRELTEEQKRDILFYARAARRMKWGD